MSFRKPEKVEDDSELGVLVIDHGSAFIKVGFAGQDSPKLILPTMLGRSKGENVQEYIGADALHAYRAEQNEANAVQLLSPIQNGEIVDWDAMQRIWEFIFRRLRIEPARYSVLLALPPPIHHTKALATRERIAQVFFQQFRFRSLCIFNACVLSLFATGRTCGLVIECGEDSTYAVPVFEGFALPHATSSLPIGGALLSSHVVRLLNRAQSQLANSADGRAFLAAQQVDQPFEFVLPAHVDVVRDLKEKRLCVLADADANTPKLTQNESVYELPDGQYIHIDAFSRYRSTEILFNPAETDPALTKGIHELAYDAIIKCDNFLQRDLFRNVVVSGGTSMLEGFGDRLHNELSTLDRGTHEIEVIQDSQRRNAAWIGGSMFASLPTFAMMKVSKQEFEENPQNIHKKYF